MIEIDKCDVCGKELNKVSVIACWKCYNKMIEEKNAHINCLAKNYKKLKEENDFLLKRVEELENNLCPSCGKM